MLDMLVKFASRLRDNGVTTFEITAGNVTLKVMQNPLPPSADELKRQRDADLYSAG
jgi:hypothetical protein